ncbi:MAG: hypothetical protein ACI9O1_000982 [Candidatus Thalassarchaeaceae archaeon]|jgi:hypothetical protein
MQLVDTLPIILVIGVFLFIISYLVVEFYLARTA